MALTTVRNKTVCVHVGAHSLFFSDCCAGCDFAEATQDAPSESASSTPSPTMPTAHRHPVLPSPPVDNNIFDASRIPNAVAECMATFQDPACCLASIAADAPATWSLNKSALCCCNNKNHRLPRHPQ